MYYKTTASVTISKSSDKYSPLSTQEIEFLTNSKTTLLDVVSSDGFKEAVLSQMFVSLGDDVYSYTFEDLVSRKSEDLIVSHSNVLDYIVGVEFYQEPCDFKKNDRVYLTNDSLAKKYPARTGTIIRCREDSPLMYVLWDHENGASVVSKFDVEHILD